MKIPIARTDLNKFEIEAVLEPLKSGWLVQGPKVNEFEKKWSNFTGSKHSIAVTSCTSALSLSLAALNFSFGDEAIVPAFTWISTANVVEHFGGKVVFCDINLNTFNIDVSKIESLITEKTKVILPVHLFGLSADIDPILKIAQSYDLNIVEDAACGFGSFYNGKHVGTFGNTGCFSFHPRKAITTGEGGMITTNDEKLASKLRCLRDHGADISDLQRHTSPKPYLLADHNEAGYNQRMTDIQAALGSKQMDRADEITKERKRLAQNYDDAFKNLDWLKIPEYKNNFVHGFQSYPCIYSNEIISLDNLSYLKEKRNNFMNDLQSKGISTRPATHAVHMLKFFKDKYKISNEKFLQSYFANEVSISLPLFHGMTSKEQDYVISVVKKHKP